MFMNLRCKSCKKSQFLPSQAWISSKSLANLKCTSGAGPNSMELWRCERRVSGDVFETNPLELGTFQTFCLFSSYDWMEKIRITWWYSHPIIEFQPSKVQDFATIHSMIGTLMETNSEWMDYFHGLLMEMFIGIGNITKKFVSLPSYRENGDSITNLGAPYFQTPI